MKRVNFIVSAVGVCLFSVAAALAIAADEKPAKETAKKGDSAKSKVTLTVADWEETLKLVAAHKGKVVVLDAWSTSCEPCKKEFPNLVKLHQKYGGKEVVCMSLSCDYAGIKSKPPEFYRDRVLKFLEKEQAVFQNLLSSVPADELFDKMGLSSIPAVYVFGADGKLAKRFDNEQAKVEEDNFTYADVNKLVDELVKKR